MNVVKGLGLKFLSTQDLEAIHEATLRVLEEHGLKVFGDEALEIYSAAGCDVDKANNMVKIPRRLVEDAIAAAPSRILMAGRESQVQRRARGHAGYLYQLRDRHHDDGPRNG